MPLDGAGRWLGPSKLNVALSWSMISVKSDNESRALATDLADYFTQSWSSSVPHWGWYW
jgi:hypothetical protein